MCNESKKKLIYQDRTEGASLISRQIMNHKTVFVFISAFFQLWFQVGSEKNDFYRAAVVEFSSIGKQDVNIKEYEWFIKQSKEADVDIIVFPENSIHGVDEDIETKLSEIPDPEDKIIPCKNPNFQKWKILERLSCAAQEYTIYVVVNILERVPCNVSSPNCPGEGRFVYNSDVVFDRAGRIISRYRKFNLYDEYFVSKLDEPEFGIFDTDFGVRFGVFTSLDILFKTPSYDLVEKYNITNFVHPSYWYGELPFLTALQIQSGWSYAMNVNLLAAGASKPMTGTGGTGIFVGNKGPPIFSMSDRESSTALICRVPKNVRRITDDNSDKYAINTITLDEKADENGSTSRLNLQRDSTLKNFQSLVLREDETEFREEICSGRSLCCQFKVSYKKNVEATDKSHTYRAVAYQGDKSFTKDTSGAVEVCAIILCTGPKLEDCGKRPETSSQYAFVFNKITIEASFSNNQTIQMPNILLGNGLQSRKTKMVLLGSGHYDFGRKERGNTRHVKLVLKDELRSVITFGIYGRDFSINKGLALHHTLYLLIFSLFFVGYFK